MKKPIQMTDSAQKYFDAIMLTLGKKTKTAFYASCALEFDKTYSHETHQMLTLGDIGRIADKMGISISKLFSEEHASN